MATILIADDVIANPAYGKISPFTSDGFTRAVNDIYGTSTDCEFGGKPIIWDAVSNGIQATGCWRTENGIFRAVKGGSSASVCLNHEFFNFELNFHVVEIESDISGQIFIDLLRQLETTETFRLRLNQNNISFLYRTASNTTETLGTFEYRDGDQIAYEHINGMHIIKSNNIEVLRIQRNYTKTGYIGVSKTSTSSSGVVHLDKFVIYAK